jgi:hypothetical protein
MSAHYDGGEVIGGRRLREVEVAYVEDPTLDMGRDDDDDGVISPPVSCLLLGLGPITYIDVLLLQQCMRIFANH